ncbi:MAG TPA: hypothetical protein VEH27_08710 [Methylomirabilota bacterium]|nr:hypothetical protein [Methylomirabilota bacterium]
MALKLTALLIATGTLLSLRADDFQGSTHLMPYDEDTLQYSKAREDNAISRLQARIDSGAVKFAWDEKFGYLPDLLRELKVATNSQSLVFSKTSLQRERISPKNPRALYFNDDIYLGFIPGSPILEVSVADPKLGGVFYTFEQKPTERPKFTRTDQCLECHASAKTMGVPGHLLRSFETDSAGSVDLATGTSLLTHRTPLEERWGGWYVTGAHGDQLHRGNLIGKEAFKRQATEPNHKGNLDSLSEFFETKHYPAASSDIVALMTLEHQAHMHNFITRLNYAGTLAMAQYGHVNYLKSIVEAFVRYTLYVEEAPLKAPLKGNTRFAEDFAAQGPKDSQGRSLRDFDLKTRLFKHPCSFLIHSEAFDALPQPVKERVYARLWEVLSGKEKSADYERLTPDNRKAIREILAETKPGLPEYWTKPGA